MIFPDYRTLFSDHRTFIPDYRTIIPDEPMFISDYRTIFSEKPMVIPDEHMFRGSERTGWGPLMARTIIPGGVKAAA